MRKVSLFILLVLFASPSLYAQPLDSSSPDKLQEAAAISLIEGDYYNALDLLSQSYKEDNDKEIAVRIASLHYILRDYKKAKSWFNRILRRDKRGQYNDLRFLYGKTLKMLGEYQEARVAFNEYIGTAEDPLMIKKAKKEIEGIQLAQKLEPKQGLVIENAGDNVNSKNMENGPVMTSLDKLYYSSFDTNKKVVLDGDEGNWQAKIYVSQRGSGDEGWGKGKALDKQINRTGFHTGNVAFSSDGEYMYFTRQRLSNGNMLISSSIYASKRKADGWAPPRELKGIGDGYLAKHPSPGELYGDKVLFFVSNMEGGYGGWDLYYTKQEGEFEFGNPVNLGATLNTDGDEVTPYYLDGKIYFSSDGHVNIGGFDIYTSSWNGTNWSDPENLGPPYNSRVDDLYFNIDEDGTYGMLVSNRPGTNSIKSETCCDDIYSVFLDNILVDLVTEVFDEEKKPLNGVNVTLIETANNVEMSKQTKQNASGNQLVFPLLRDRAYILLASKDGYDTDSLEFNTVGIRQNTSLKKELYLAEAVPEFDTYTIEQPIRLNNIYYDFDDDKILIESEQDLNLLLGLMNQYADMVIELSSHTDSRGKDDYNQDLSQRRANSARAWLLDKGVDEARIKAVGYGESQILNQCTNGKDCTEDEHRFNRRTEFKILAGPKTIKVKRTTSNSGNGAIEEDDIDPSSDEEQNTGKKK